MLMNKKKNLSLVIYSILVLALIGITAINVKMIFIFFIIPAFAYLFKNTKIWIYVYLVYLVLENILFSTVFRYNSGLIKYGFEAFSYVVLLIVLLKVFKSNKKIEFNKIDFSILTFVVVCLISAFINNVDFKIAILGLRWFLRYIVIYYIVKLNYWSLEDIKRIIKYILGIAIFEVVLGLIQLRYESILRSFLVPNTYDIDSINVYGEIVSSKYAIYGTFGRYNEYAFFLLIVIALLISYYELMIKRKYLKTMLLITISCLVLSYSRQGVLGIIVAWIIIVLSKKNLKTKRATIITLLVISVFSLLIFFSINQVSGKGTIYSGITERFSSIFSIEAWEFDYYNRGRLYFMTDVNKIFLTTKPLFGYGVGMYGTDPAIRYNPEVYLQLGIPIRFSMDVFWTSIIGQIGLVGTISFLFIYIVVYKEFSKNLIESKNPYNRIISLSVDILILATVVMSFFSSAFGDRYLMFFLWVFIGFRDYFKSNSQVQLKKS